MSGKQKEGLPVGLPGGTAPKPRAAIFLSLRRAGSGDKDSAGSLI